jgi:hypothetical protein
METFTTSPEEMFPLDIQLPKEQLYAELDVRLNHFFDRYVQDGMLQAPTDTAISGKLYLKVFREATDAHPEITAKIFEDYVKYHRKMYFPGKGRFGKAAVYRPFSRLRPPTISNKDKAANDHTLDEE